MSQLSQINVTRDGISKTAADAVRLSETLNGVDERLKLLMGAWLTEVEQLKGRFPREAATSATHAQTALMWALLATSAR